MLEISKSPYKAVLCLEPTLPILSISRETSDAQHKERVKKEFILVLKFCMKLMKNHCITLLLLPELLLCLGILHNY